MEYIFQQSATFWGDYFFIPLWVLALTCAALGFCARTFGDKVFRMLSIFPFICSIVLFVLSFEYL